MAKVALLVDFEPRTRVVVDVPDGMSVEEYLQDNDNFDNLAAVARHKMVLDGIEEYLNGENLVWQKDKECPFGTFSWDV